MSQFEAPYEPAVVEEKTSGVAIAALVCSLILCCPLTTVLGVVLGLVGFLTAKKGKGLAIVAVIIGVIGTGLWFVGGNWVYKNAVIPMMAGPRDALVAGFDGDTAGFRDAMAPGFTASDAEIEAFIAELRSRHGELTSVQYDPNQANPQPAPGQSEAPVSYILMFDSGDQISCTTAFVFADEQTGDIVMRPRALRIEGGDGTLEIPVGGFDGGGAVESPDPEDAATDGEIDGDTGG